MLCVIARNPWDDEKSTKIANILAGGGIAPIVASVGAQAAPNKERTKRPLTKSATAGTIAPEIAAR